MTKKEMVLWYVVVAAYCYCGGALSNSSEATPLKNYCETQVLQYQKNQSCFHTRHARAEHLLDLIRASHNKFKLINDLYLHYRSIDNTTSELSWRLELCLVNLLKLSTITGDLTKAIEKRNNSLLLTHKLQDPVHEVIADHVANKKYLILHRTALKHLVDLDTIETSILYHASIDKSDFALAVPIGEPIPIYQLNPSKVLSDLFKLSEDIRQELVSQAQKEAYTFAQQPSVKQALVINSLSREALRNLQNRIPLSNLPKFARAYEAVIENMPPGLGWCGGTFDSENILTSAKEFKHLLAGNDALMTKLESAVKNFAPTRQKIGELKNTVEALYVDVVFLCEKVLEIEQENNYKNKSLIATLKELKHYARHADEILRDKIFKTTSNRDLETIELIRLLAEDLIEAFSERGGDVRARIESAFGDY